MEEKTVIVMVLAAVLAVGMFSTIGMYSYSSATGAAMTSSRGCICNIAQTPRSYGGEPAVVQVQFIKAHPGANVPTDSWCQNRCEIMFKRNNVVVGYAAPFEGTRPRA